jgi:Xaa-Pro aminopeptidase
MFFMPSTWQKSFRRHKLSAAYFAQPANVRWLTRFKSEARILATPKKIFIFADARESESVRRKIPCDWKLVLLDEHFRQNFRQLLKQEKIKTIAVEDTLSLAGFKKFRTLVRGHSRLKTVPDFFTNLRRIKTAEELKQIRRACAITDQIFNQLTRELRRGMTEKNLAWRIRELAHKFGADGLSFSPIVAFGENSGVPHHAPTDRKLKRGDEVLLDFGVKVDGYCSDLTRTIFTAPPTAFQKFIYETVLAVQKDALKNLRAGISTKKLYLTALKKFATFQKSFFSIENCKLKIVNYFTHSLGHGAGLQIHEAPTLGKFSKEILQAGEVVTIEPGLYFPDEFGVRIEDTVLVGKNNAQALTRAGKKLMVVRI